MPPENNAENAESNHPPEETEEERRDREAKERIEALKTQAKTAVKEMAKQKLKQMAVQAGKRAAASAARGVLAAAGPYIIPALLVLLVFFTTFGITTYIINGCGSGHEITGGISDFDAWLGAKHCADEFGSVVAETIFDSYRGSGADETQIPDSSPATRTATDYDCPDKFQDTSGNRQTLSQFTVYSSGGCSDPLNIKCTSLQCVEPLAIQLLQRLAKECEKQTPRCTVIVTGGTEVGHRSHGPEFPYTFDIRYNANQHESMRRAFQNIDVTESGNFRFGYTCEDATANKKNGKQLVYACASKNSNISHYHTEFR